VTDQPAGKVTRWTDSHCHLQDHYEPAADALARAATAGVESVVCVGTDAATSAAAISLARHHLVGSTNAEKPRVVATIGLHPHQATEGTQAIARLVGEVVAAADSTVVAIGECGLDYHYVHSPRHVQRRAFAEQIALAHQTGLALVIHARDAWDDLFDVLLAEGVPERAVLHCFTGGPHEAQRCLDAGMFISFSGIVTFKNAESVREAVRLCPTDRLLIETDSPFLAPVPHRGRQNEPAFVSLVGSAVASLKGLADTEFAQMSTDVARRVFRF